MRQHGEEFVLGRHLALEARSGFLELPRPEVFLEDRVAEHLQQFTMHDELGLGHGLLLQRHRPEPLERHVADLAGRVVRVVPENGALVKAKQPLIEVEPL